MYSIDYKRRTVAFKDEGHTFKELKEAFTIPPETYYLWKEKIENGCYDRKIIRERTRNIDKHELKQALIEKPDAYVGELAEQFGCTAAAVFYALKKLNITRKKRPVPI
jgi:transposase